MASTGIKIKIKSKAAVHVSTYDSFAILFVEQLYVVYLGPTIIIIADDGCSDSSLS